MYWLNLGLLALPIAAYFALRLTNVTALNRLRFIPLVQLGQIGALMWIDNSCDGDGFKLSWINCTVSAFEPHANAFSGLLYFNLLTVVALVPALGLLGLLEFMRARRSHRQL
ncbi:hypothetical protein [Aestuariibius sp. HNIBRBA575]|uniref:hypothetical protein n=1 Tax=Aestuariibius sp. HNIBRBA575 TaxID=3233343 RepID=UPI0034A22157